MLKTTLVLTALFLSGCSQCKSLNIYNAQLENLTGQAATVQFCGGNEYKPLEIEIAADFFGDIKVDEKESSDLADTWGSLMGSGSCNKDKNTTSEKVNTLRLKKGQEVNYKLCQSDVDKTHFMLIKNTENCPSGSFELSVKNCK